MLTVEIDLDESEARGLAHWIQLMGAVTGFRDISKGCAVVGKAMLAALPPEVPEDGAGDPK